MKVAMMEVFGSDSYDCSCEIASHVSEWAEVSHEEFMVLQRYVSRMTRDKDRRVLLLTEPYPREKVADTLQQAIKIQLTEEARQKKRQEEQQEKKRLARLARERKKFEELKKKFV